MNKVHFPKEARELIQNGMLAELMSKGVHLDSEKVKAIILDNLPQLRVDYNRLANELKGKFHQPRDGENGRDGDRGYQGVDGTPGIDGKHGKNGLDGTNGINGERGPAGKNGKDYHLTRNDKKTITESIKGKIDLEPYLLKMSFNEQVTTLIRNIESGKIKSKRSGGGFNIKDIIGEINKYVGTEDWQTGAAETVNYGVANTAIQVLKSGDQSSTTSWADLTGWGTPGIIDADFTFADGVTTIVSDGTYNINLIIQAAIATADFSEIQTKMQLDTGSGYADIPGCFDYSPAANQTGFYDGTPATTKTITAQIANFAIELTAGDKIKPLIQHIQTAGLVSTGNARISILRLK
jgi:hypothetical protein